VLLTAARLSHDAQRWTSGASLPPTPRTTQRFTWERIAMFSHTELKARLERDVDAFASHPLFASLEWGCTERDDYDAFLRRVARTHLKAPQVHAFLWSVAPPAVAPGIRHRMLEESGLEPDGLDSPARLERLLRAAGLGREVRELHLQAQDDLHKAIARPLRCRTLREVGLAVLAEVVAFDYLLSLMAGRCAAFLREHRGISPDAVSWFTHQSEAGAARAEEALDRVAAYLAYYEIDPAEAQPILDAVLRGNVFLQRYFGPVAVPAAASLGTACLEA
jgi:hypothetical protein